MSELEIAWTLCGTAVLVVCLVLYVSKPKGIGKD